MTSFKTMSTTAKYHHTTGGIKDHIYRILTRIITAVVPRARRRFILMSSLAPIILGKKSSTEHFRSLINVSLSLCRSEEAMLLPILIYELFYTDTQIAKIQQLIESKTFARNHECMEVASQIYSVVPAWLLYDEPADVVADITTLLALRPALT